MARRPAGIDAVVFDLDGVLVDSEIWWDEVRADFARGHERPWTEEDRLSVMGANSRQWARTMRERLGIDVAEEAIERAIVDGVVARYRAEGPPHIEGAVDAVRRIAGLVPVAVASSAHRDVIQAALDATDLTDVFAAVVSSDEVERGKPEPDVYLEAARRLGVEPERCLVVEDSLNGVRAGRAAGMTVVLVPNRSIPPADGAVELADVVVDHLEQLDPAALRSRRRARRGEASARATAAPANVPPEAAGAPTEPGEFSQGAPPPSEASPSEASPTAPSRPTRKPHEDLPGPRLHPWRRTIRYWLARLFVGLLVRSYVRLLVEGRERLPGGPAVYCFNHLNWADPFVLMATLPYRPRLYFFGPKEEDMARGGRNRIMGWTGAAVPYKPGKNDLLEAARKVRAVFATGGVLAIAGEGRIHAGESELLPLNEGAAYFAIRSGVPIVPVAINGTSWLQLGRRVRVRIGEPIATAGRPTREAVAEVTERTWQALHALVADHPDSRPPGRFGRWLTELFNDWPDGKRPGRSAA